MALKDKKPVPNMVDICANSKKALLMKDMGNGHMRPCFWGTSVTVVSGSSSAVVASGTLGGIDADLAVYSPSPVNTTDKYHIVKDSVTHGVTVERDGGAASVETVIDVFVFMSAAVDITISDYTGKRNYSVGNY